VEQTTRDELLRVLDRSWASGVDQFVGVLTVLYTKLVEVTLKLVPQFLHSGHVGVQNGVDDSLSNDANIFFTKSAT